MTLSMFLKVLKTASSEVSNRTLFKNRFTCYIPDLFFISLYATLFFFCGVIDIFFTVYLFIFHKQPIQSGIYLATIILPGITEFLLDNTATECLPDLRINKCFIFVLSVLGFSSVFYFSRACTDILVNARKMSTKRLKCFTFPFFHIQNDTLSAIKLFCFFSSVLKNLPRLFILPLLILQENLDDFSAYLGVTLIMLNMTIFSLTVAITFPIRSAPRVFTSSICVVFSAFNKFMATMSSCCVVLGIFATVYKSIHFYALLVPFSRCLTWSWPCWRALSCQTVPPRKFNLAVYFFFLTFICSFIYIHPFEGIGKLHYYFFYLLDFLEEIIVIYIFTDVSLDSVTGYFSFRVVMIGFLSSFGLINILHKYKEEKTKFGCVSYTSVVSENQENEQKNSNNEGRDKASEMNSILISN